MDGNEGKGNHKLGVRLAVVLFLLAVIIGFFTNTGECYRTLGAEPVIRTRFEVFIDYVRGIDYEEIIWNNKTERELQKEREKENGDGQDL